MLHLLAVDIDYDRAVASIFVLRRIETGLQQADRGEGTEHEELMRELLGSHFSPLRAPT
jgi:predicted transcriptional regulator